MNNNITEPTVEELQNEQAAVAMLLAMAQATVPATSPEETPPEQVVEDDLPTLVAELKDLTSQVKTLEVALQNVSARLANVRSQISRWMSANLPEEQKPQLVVPTPAKPAAPKPRPLDNSIVFDTGVGIAPGGAPASPAEQNLTKIPSLQL